jgi:hypothetical protein
MRYAECVVDAPQSNHKATVSLDLIQGKPLLRGGHGGIQSGAAASSTGEPT